MLWVRSPDVYLKYAESKDKVSEGILIAVYICRINKRRGRSLGGRGATVFGPPRPAPRRRLSNNVYLSGNFHIIAMVLGNCYFYSSFSQGLRGRARHTAGCGWESLMKNVTLGNVTMSHRTREARMPCVSLPLNYDRSAARSTRELVHSLQMYCKLFLRDRRTDSNWLSATTMFKGDSKQFVTGTANWTEIKTKKRARRAAPRRLHGGELLKSSLQPILFDSVSRATRARLGMIQFQSGARKDGPGSFAATPSVITARARVPRRPLLTYGGPVGAMSAVIIYCGYRD
ncbi:hypothetical protein EVAR_32913_1 [Eumeta japonica]|uniref:Uncharacterized protein n=1 Tax=Eumeta variegata TaxID=151549 RepID=A0A4C1ZYE8_EUMVA|nr:hypothetical protein EVAR_32913_1 [Eumeta japonica]